MWIQKIAVLLGFTLGSLGVASAQYSSPEPTSEFESLQESEIPNTADDNYGVLLEDNDALQEEDDEIGADATPPLYSEEEYQEDLEEEASMDPYGEPWIESDYYDFDPVEEGFEDSSGEIYLENNSPGLDGSDVDL